MSRPVATARSGGARGPGRIARWLFAAVLCAGPAPAAPVLTENLVWHDNGQARLLWLNPDLVAEFRPTTAGRAAMREVHPAARPRMNGSVRVWELQPGIGVRRVLEQLRAVYSEGRYAPVFHDGPSVRNGQRVPTGELIVVVAPDWNHARLARLARRERLELVGRLEDRADAWRLRAEDGFTAIESANRLETSGEVRSAAPLWWRPRGIPLH